MELTMISMLRRFEWTFSNTAEAATAILLASAILLMAFA
jgi:hypothetical protein